MEINTCVTGSKLALINQNCYGRKEEKNIWIKLLGKENMFRKILHFDFIQVTHDETLFHTLTYN